jgi:hypothetical protein
MSKGITYKDHSDRKINEEYMRKEIEKKLFNIELQDKFGKYDLIRL